MCAGRSGVGLLLAAALGIGTCGPTTAAAAGQTPGGGARITSVSQAGAAVAELDFSATGEDKGSDGQRIMSVVVTGVGLDAEKAKRSGLSRAVEQTVGVMVDAETLVQNDQLVRDKVLTYTRGDVTKAEVLDQWQKEGLWYVRIRASVAAHTIRSRLRAHNLAVRELDGDVFYDNVKRRLDNLKNATEMLAGALRDFGPESLLKLQIIGRPDVVSQDEQFATIRVRLAATPDMENWQEFRAGVLQLLESNAQTKRSHGMTPCRDREYEETKFYALAFQGDVTEWMWKIQRDGEDWGYWIILVQSFFEDTEPHVMRSAWDSYAVNKSVAPIFAELAERKYGVHVSLLSKTDQSMAEAERELTLWDAPMRCLYAARDGSWRKDSYFLGPFLWGGGGYYSPGRKRFQEPFPRPARLGKGPTPST